VDFVHWGKFFMRVGHNIVLGCFSPRQRVMVAMTFAFAGCLIPPLFVFALDFKWMGFVFFSYGLSGMGIGIFETTFLSVITPLGRRTKSYAMVAIPTGFAIINFGGMLLTSLGMPVENLYWYVCACLPIGLIIFQVKAPAECQSSEDSFKQARLAQSVGDWRSWVPLLMPCLIAKVILNFAMENITPVSFYTFNGKVVPLFGPAETTNLINHDIFFALMAFLTLIGNAGSVYVAYQFRLRRYSGFVFIMILSCIGGIASCWFVTLKIAIVSLGAVFLAFWSNGTVYGASSSFIDFLIPKEHNLAAYSVWCMIGDLGPILGGAMMDVLRSFICDGEVYPYVCRNNN